MYFPSSNMETDWWVLEDKLPLREVLWCVHFFVDSPLVLARGSVETILGMLPLERRILFGDSTR